MGKRSNFKRIEKDFYETPKEAVLPLLPHINLNGMFYEPCCGNMALVNHLAEHGMRCGGCSDDELDARYHQYQEKNFYYFITNPPWTREILHPIIDNLRKQHSTWLLFDADWMHTKQAIPYLTYCHKIVSVGRIKWIPNSKYTGKDNCCWYQFSSQPEKTTFIGRTE